MFVKYEIPEILRDKNYVIIEIPQNEHQLKNHLFLRGIAHEDFTIDDIKELLEAVDNYEEIDLIGNPTYKLTFKGKEFLTLTIPMDIEHVS